MRARREAHCGTRTRWRACGAPRKRFETFLIDCDGFFFVKLNEEYVFSRRHVRLLAFEEGEAARRERMRDSQSESARAPQRGNKKCVCVSERERERESFFSFFSARPHVLAFFRPHLLAFFRPRSLPPTKEETDGLSLFSFFSLRLRPHHLPLFLFQKTVPMVDTRGKKKRKRKNYKLKNKL